MGGSCLCHGVRFEVELPFRRANHCHCGLCRKHSGSFGLTQGRVPRERFRLLAGEELVRAYRPSGGTAVKAFCLRCGASLFGARWPDGDEIGVRLGALDGDPGIRPQYRSFVGSKAEWDVIADDLPQYELQPPAHCTLSETAAGS